MYWFFKKETSYFKNYGRREKNSQKISRKLKNGFWLKKYKPKE